MSLTPVTLTRAQRKGDGAGRVCLPYSLVRSSPHAAMPTRMTQLRHRQRVRKMPSSNRNNRSATSKAGHSKRPSAQQQPLRVPRRTRSHHP